MGMKLIAGDLRTGLIRVRAIPATQASGTQLLAGPGSLSCTVGVPWVDAVTGTTIDLPNLLLPGKSFLAFDFNGYLLEAGPIWTDVADWDTNSIDYKGSGIESLFDYRHVIPVLAAGQLPRDVTLAWITSLETQAKRVVETAIAGLGGELPIVFEADIPGTAEREFKGSDKVKAAQALANLRDVENGPDIVFRPRYQSDPRFIEWVMRTGTPLVQDGDVHVWDTSVPGSTVSGLNRTRDATVLSTTDIETGTTVDDVLQEAVAVDPTLIVAGFPRYETSVSRQSVEDPATLLEHAVGAVTLGRTYLETISFKVKRAPTIDGIKAGPWLGEYPAGDMAQIVLGKNPFKPKGRYPHRVVQIGFDLGEDVAITCMPERTSGAYPQPITNARWLAKRLRSLQDAVDESTRGR